LTPRKGGKYVGKQSNPRRPPRPRPGDPVHQRWSSRRDETYKDRNGERQKRTEWHKIVVWGKQAEIAQQYLKKGSLIFIEGRIQSREWQDKEGQKRTSFEIVATNFRMLGGRGDAVAAGAGAGAARGGGDDFDSQAGPPEETYGAGGGHAPAGPEIFPSRNGHSGSSLGGEFGKLVEQS
jgi:single-strand DNA-binding protein